MNTTTIAYFAGFFDGDGSVMLPFATPVGGKAKNPVIRVVLTNTDRGVIEEARQLWGGFIWDEPKYQPHHRPSYRLTMSQKLGLKFLYDVLPYLRIKKSRAKLVIDFSALGTMVGTPEEKEDILAQRYAYVEALWALNQKGGRGQKK